MYLVLDKKYIYIYAEFIFRIYAGKEEKEEKSSEFIGMR